MQNHVIDPTYFYDAIEEFAFNYTLYVKQYKQTASTWDMAQWNISFWDVTTMIIDAAGYPEVEFIKVTVRGSLQSAGAQIIRSKTGNTVERIYDFYCKSLYRIHIDDVIVYKNNYFICTDVNDYDEWGVRHAKFKMFTLTQYRDFAEFMKYQTGKILV